MTMPVRLSRPLATRGFTLLELMLAIGLMAFLLAGLYGFLDRWARNAADHIAATEMLRVQHAAESYVTANFETLKTSGINSFQSIPIATLKAATLLPTGFQAFNVYKQSITVYRRSLRVARRKPDGSAATTPTGQPLYYYSIEVVTLSGDPAAGTLRVGSDRLVNAARTGGPFVGIVYTGTIGTTTFTNVIRSLSGSWSINLADVAAAGYAATPAASGGYLATYGIVNAENSDTNDDWLYRMDINGHPELNRMETNLNMNGNSVQNVGTLVADRVNVTGNTSFLGLLSGGTSETGGAMTVDQALRVAGTGESRINMKDANNACTLSDDGTGKNNRMLSGAGCNITGGELQVVANGSNDATFNTNTLSADGSVLTNNTSVGNVLYAKGATSFDTVTGSTLSNSGMVVTPTTNVTGNAIFTQELQTGNLAVAANSSVGAVTAARIQPGNGHRFTSQNLNIANTAAINGNLQVHAMNTTTKLYINNASGTFYDSAMGRNVVCTPDPNGRTYCEPSGTHTWGNGDVETCYANQSFWGKRGYTCDFVRGGIYIGTCRYSRGVSGDNRAYFVYEGCS